MTGPPAWLRRRDPGLVAYALFGAVALGGLSQIPGSPAQRARTLLAVLPVGWLLITLGTLLSVSTAAATAGMFVLGFVVSYVGVGVGGPRLVGLATGLQLLYILPCFPPYDPGSLGWRLAGFSLVVLLLAGAELVPDPTPPTQRPASAGRRDRALTDAASTARLLLDDPAELRVRVARVADDAVG